MATRTTPKKDLTPTSVTQWKKSVESVSARPLELPSGNVALVQRPGLNVFIQAGMIPNALMGIVQKSMEKKDVDQNEFMERLQADPNLLSDMLLLVNRITVYCVVEPTVTSEMWTQAQAEAGECKSSEVGQVIPPSKRDPEALYVDEVDLDDKMYIFQVAVGGTADLERFREGSPLAVEPVRRVTDSTRPAKRAASRKR